MFKMIGQYVKRDLRNEYSEFFEPKPEAPSEYYDGSKYIGRSHESLLDQQGPAKSRLFSEDNNRRAFSPLNSQQEFIKDFVSDGSVRRSGFVDRVQVTKKIYDNHNATTRPDSDNNQLSAFQTQNSESHMENLQ